MKLYQNLEIYTDYRGKIVTLSPPEMSVKSVLYITGGAGAVRGDHVHSKDTHYCYCLEGEIIYRWKCPQCEEHETHEEVLKPGDCVFTPAEEPHCFIFKTQGVFVAMATEPRTQQSYEEDTKKYKIS